MLLNPQKEIEGALRDLRSCFSKTNPNDQFRAVMLHMLFDLYGTADRIRKTRDVKERGCLLDEFSKKKHVFKKGIALPSRRSQETKGKPEQRLRHAMP